MHEQRRMGRARVIATFFNTYSPACGGSSCAPRVIFARIACRPDAPRGAGGRRCDFQGIGRFIPVPGRAQYRNSGNMKELVKPLKTYKGYEIHPLIYPRGARDGGAAVRAADTGYEASVRIRRAPPAGEEATGESRVFRIEQTGSFENGGQARRACLLHAEKLIDGQIDGQTVADL
jgi:hypothetical protein